MNIENRSFFGAMTGTIKALCKSLVGALDVVNSGIGMAQEAVYVAEEKQAIDLTIEMSQYQKMRTSEAITREAQMEELLEKYAKETPDRAARVERLGKELDQKLNQKLAERRARRIS